jgi:3D (Asp-Asp-Asp) domain-containing protein
MQDLISPRRDSSTSSVRSFVSTARGRVEIAGFVAALSITVASAIAAKEAGSPPALAQTDVRTASLPVAQLEQPLPTISAQLEELTGVEIEEATPEEMAELGVDPLSVRWFNGRQVRPARTIWMTVTAYSPDHRSCGKWADGITASNKSVWTNGMKLVAADTRILPFRSLVSVPGYDEGRIVPVLDRGGAIKGARLDVLYPTHEIALRWGVQRLPVTVWEYVD